MIDASPFFSTFFRSILPSLAGQVLATGGASSPNAAQFAAAPGTSQHLSDVKKRRWFHAESTWKSIEKLHVGSYIMELGDKYHPDFPPVSLVLYENTLGFPPDFPTQTRTKTKLRRLALDMAPLVSDLRSLAPWCGNKIGKYGGNLRKI